MIDCLRADGSLNFYEISGMRFDGFCSNRAHDYHEWNIDDCLAG